MAAPAPVGRCAAPCAAPRAAGTALNADAPATRTAGHVGSGRHVSRSGVCAIGVVHRRSTGGEPQAAGVRKGRGGGRGGGRARGGRVVIGGRAAARSAGRAAGRRERRAEACSAACTCSGPAAGRAAASPGGQWAGADGSMRCCAGDASGDLVQRLRPGQSASLWSGWRPLERVASRARETFRARRAARLPPAPSC